MPAARRPADCVRDIADWFAVHAPPCRERLLAAAPASAESVDALRAELGADPPGDLLDYLAVTDGGLAFWEYEGLDAGGMLRRRRRLCESLSAGGFDGHEVFPDDRGFLRPGKWHPGWLPFAEDGGGNLFCVDLAPGPAGTAGQVFSWERLGGPGISTPRPRTFGAFLSDYRDLLLSGRFTYDADSGTFDGPSVDGARP
jgi:cell wall assembly regulator SMI1